MLKCGTTVPLLAGASAFSTPAIGGALPFSVNAPPSGAWWDIGSDKRSKERKKKTIS